MLQFRSLMQLTLAVALSLDFNAPPFAPKNDCRNVFIVTTWPGGFGHRVSALAIAIAWAIDCHAALVIDMTTLALSVREGANNEKYSYWPRLLGFGPFKAVINASQLLTPGLHPTPWGSLHFMRTPTALASVEAARNSCGHILHLGTGQANACRRKVWCTYAAPGAFERARPLMRQLYASSKSAAVPCSIFLTEEGSGSPRPLRVAWHVRVGDVALHQNASYFRELAESVARGLGSARATHFLFSERRIPDEAPGFAFLLELPFIQFHQHAHTRVDVAFRHLAAADVLVTSGSSFAYAAALVGSEEQVVLFAEPKESLQEGQRGAIATYRLAGKRVIDIGPDGSLRSSGERQLADLVRARYKKRP
jgi:hypothetical protein